MRRAPLAAAVISEEAATPVRRALGRDTPLTATLRPGIAIHQTTVHNVLALVEADAPASGDMVVVGAHLDHDGTDDDGRVYNGADDNASGTAAVLAMAAAFARAADAGQRPRRRIVFALWNAEEKGSLGSEAYVASPVPAGRVVANLNLDMVGRAEDVPDATDPRFRGFRRTTAAGNANTLHVLGYSHSPDLAALARQANRAVGLKLRLEYDRGAQGLIRRSDNWPFLKRSIPALFFTTGLHPDYHTPDDDVERIDVAKLERIAELVGRLAWLVAAGEPPRYREP
jgi:Zn-dependent M28 family amino/carboxypeptidase